MCSASLDLCRGAVFHVRSSLRLSCISGLCLLRFSASNSSLVASGLALNVDDWGLSQSGALVRCEMGEAVGLGEILPHGQVPTMMTPTGAIPLI
jgi:hypothetical protein